MTGFWHASPPFFTFEPFLEHSVPNFSHFYCMASRSMSMIFRLEAFFQNRVGVTEVVI